MVQDRIPWKVRVLCEPSPQMGRLLSRGVPVANGFGIKSPVGVFTVTILALMTPFAFAAHDVVFQEHQVSLLKALSSREFPAGPVDVTDIFVAHNYRSVVRWRRLVKLHVGSTNTRDLHLQQSTILVDIRHGEFADFGLARTYSDSCQRFLHL